MYNPSKNKQLGIFGDGWLYQTILSQIKEHPLRRLKPVVDKLLNSMDTKLMSYYSPYEGRPSFSPACIFKMLLLEYLYGLSDVQVSRTCVHDILFRWFIGLEPDERVPDDTTLVKFRGRLGEEGFREIFDELVMIANKEGFIKGKLRAIDATHIFSDTIKPGPIALIKQGIKKVIKEVGKIHKEVSVELEKKYKKFLKQTVRKGNEKIEEAQKKGKKFIKEVRVKIEFVKSKALGAKEVLGKRVMDNIKTLVDTLENVVEGNSLQVVSFSDLDARWGRKSQKKVFGGYKIHTICATGNGFISGVDVLCGNVNEGRDMPAMIEEEERRGLEVEGVVGDKLYDSKENREYLSKNNKKAYIPPRFACSGIDAFKVSGGKVKCRAGKYAIGKVRQEGGDLFYFPTKDCAVCKYKRECLRAKEKRKRVWISDCKRLRDREYKKKYKERLVIERKFGEAKRWHGLDRARYRGRWRVAIQALMVFTVMNLKLMANMSLP